MLEDYADVRKETLRLAGIDDSPPDLEVIDCSPPHPSRAGEVYSKTNQVLRSEIRKKPLGKNIHITGEMRAISYPDHRGVIREDWESHRELFEMVCYMPPESRRSAAEIWKWNRGNWGNVTWQNHLDAFNLISDGEIDLYTSPERERVHFSVFGDQYVLLQSEHPSHLEEKYIWFLRSYVLNQQLGEKARMILQKSTRIPQGEFKGFLDNLSSEYALHVLFSLADSSSEMKSILSAKIGSEGYRLNILSDLMSVGFVKETNKLLNLTDDGREYLQLFS